MKKRFYKYYHPQNRHFFIHIAVDVILITAVVSVLAYTLCLAAHPIKSTLKNEIIKMPTIGRTESLTGQATAERIARTRINRELKLSAICRYKLSEGDQLGRGPLPPQINQPTRYWIFLSPTTDYFTVKNISITAELGDNVKFTGKNSVISENNILYDETSNSLNWRIDKLKRLTPETIPQGAAFEIEFIPAANQIGQTASLLKNIKISGIDEATGLDVSTTVNDLTTAISEDPAGGVIQNN